MIMKYMIALDFEFTAMPTSEQNMDGNWFPEITEIGAVLFDVYKCRTVGQFQQYVRPTTYSQLSANYQHIFGITQALVDSQTPLSMALEDLHRWIEDLQSRFNFRLMAQTNMYGADDMAYICTWSSHDLRDVLRREGKKKIIPYRGYLKYWIDMQKVVKENYPGVPGGLHYAARCLGAGSVGQHHSALDDAATLALITQSVWRDNIRNYRLNCL